MTTPSKEEMLKAVIERAVRGGWNMFGWLNTNSLREWKVIGSKLIVVSTLRRQYSANDILFDHSFARASFGSKKIRKLDYIDLDSPKARRVFVTLELWKFKLQQAVLSEDPIKYYYEQIPSLIKDRA